MFTIIIDVGPQGQLGVAADLRTLEEPVDAARRPLRAAGLDPLDLVAVAQEDRLGLEPLVNLDAVEIEQDQVAADRAGDDAQPGVLPPPAVDLRVGRVPLHERLPGPVTLP